MPGKLILLVFGFFITASAALAECRIAPYAPFYIVNPQAYINVVQGTEGWFFNAQQDLISHFFASDENIQLLQELTATLRAVGTELVVAYIPLRSMAVPQHVPKDHPIMQERGYDPIAARKNYADLIASLNAKGINIVGTPDVKSGDQYFRKFETHHWASAGAAEMAEALVERLNKLRLIADGAGSKPEEALLENPSATRITLVGTSFSNTMPYQDALYSLSGGANIWSAAINAGGLDDSITAYLSSTVFHQNKPAIVIWEIPGYFSFSSTEMTVALRRAVAAVYGDCAQEKALSDRSYTIGLEPLKLTDGVKPEREIKGAYLAINLPMPLDRPAALEYSSNDGTQHCIQFEQPYIPPETTRFFYSLPDASLTALNSLKLHMPERFAGHQISIKLCGL